MLMMHADAYEAALKAARLEGWSRAVMAAADLTATRAGSFGVNSDQAKIALQKLEIDILKLQYTEDTHT